MTPLDVYLKLVPANVSGHDVVPAGYEAAAVNAIRELCLRHIYQMKQLDRIERAFRQLLDEPGNPYLGYEMARHELDVSLNARPQQ